MINTKKYIERCREVFPNEKYDYSNLHFINWKTKIKVYCCEKDENGKEHGFFEKDPSSFLEGHRCPKCAKSFKAYTTEEWVNMAQKKYPNMLYDRVKYVDKKTKIEIGCPKHGYFWVNPKYYLYNAKCCCSECKKERNREIKWKEYKDKIMKDVWVDKDYDLTEVEFKNSATPIQVRCKKHGYFYPTVANILSSHTICPKCAVEIQSSNRKSNIDEVINKLKMMYNNTYSYELVTEDMYKNTDSKIPIICPTHGVFKKTVHAHLSGQGCPICGRVRAGEKIAISFDEFLKRANQKHEFKYEYDRESYTKICNKVRIKCPKHGWFEQIGVAHTLGNGCPYCRESKLELDVDRYIRENGFETVTQKRFVWLGLQSIDVYVPSVNVGIECQGIYHFKTERGVTKEKVEKTQARDERKKRLCKENGLKLIYYLPEVFNQYMKEDDIYFNTTEEVLEYIKNVESDENE